jgi:DNA-binding beta-propeller fold protein YncE
MSVATRKPLQACLVSLCVLLGGLVFASAPALASQYTHEYLSQFNGALTPAGETGFAPESIAANENTGTVYVADAGEGAVDEFSSSGAYIGQLTQASGITPYAFGTSGNSLVMDRLSLTVDQSTGYVYVADRSEGAVDVFNAAGVYQSQFGHSTFGYSKGLTASESGYYIYSIAVDDSTNDVYVTDTISNVAGYPNVVDVFDSAGVLTSQWTGADTPAHSFNRSSGYPLYVAVDQSSHDVYVSDTGNGVVDRLSGSGQYLSQLTQADGVTPYQFPTDYANESRKTSLAVDGSGDVYVIDNEDDLVDEFDPAGKFIGQIRGPAVGTFGSVQSAAVGQGGELYVADTEAHKHTWSEEGGEYRHVEVQGEGVIDVFAAALEVEPPLIDGQSVGAVTATGATLNGEVDPLGEASTAYFEYGPSSAYGTSTSVQDLGAGSAVASYSAPLVSLQPGTTYHYRVVAANAAGASVAGPDRTFTTASLGSGHFALPDGRAYELVSPVEKNGGRGGVLPANYEGTIFGETVDLQSTESSPSGEAIAYVGEPFFGPQNAFHSIQYVSRRTASGWTTEVLTPAAGAFIPQEQSLVKGLSPDLSSDLVRDSGDLGPGKPAGYEENLWLRDSEGTYQPLINEAAAAFSKRTPAEAPKVGNEEENYHEFEKLREAHFAGASMDFSHVIFWAHDTLTANAEEYAATGLERPGGEEGEDPNQANLYEWVGGQLILLNVTPEGHPAPASFGSGASAATVGHEYGFTSANPLQANMPDLSDVISSDGARVFWTDDATGGLYMDENAGTAQARTVLISAGGEYSTANSEGSLVLFTKGGHLYQFNAVTGATSDLAPGGGVLGVTGVSEDGSYVYFVSSGVLASGGRKGQPNLYLGHGGETSFVATLLPVDDEYHPGSGGGAKGKLTVGDWLPASQSTAQVSPDGRYLAFLSSRSLTGYENRGAPELFRYEAEGGRLVCVSCVPSGAPPTADGALPQVTAGHRLATLDSVFATPAVNGIYRERYMLNDGRVFFDSDEALVTQDTNKTTDVYEYEDGSARLISPGTGGPSNFADASENGENVFFTTVNQLVSQDQDQNIDMYDARVGGGFPPAPSSGCTGTGCQGVPPAPPIFATPSSVTFAGVGNFTAAPPPPPLVPKTKALTKAQKLAAALQACRKQKRSKQARCEASARKRYGVAKKSSAHSDKGRK